MAVDLLSKMKDFWTSEAIHQLSVMLNAQPDRVEQALSLGAPTILAGLLKAATGTTDAHRLVDLVNREPEEMAQFGGLSGLLNHLAGLGDVVGLDPLVKYGRSALRSIFGDKLDAVLNLIATDSGTKPTTAAALMSLLAPTLMGMIREETATRGLTGDSLRNLLLAQRDSIAALAPGKLAETLGVRSLADLGTWSDPARTPAPSPVAASPGSAKGSPASVHSTTVHRTMPVSKGPSPTRWAIPLALGLLAVAAGYYLLPQANPPRLENKPIHTADLARSADPAPDKTAHVNAPAVVRDDVTSPATTADGRRVVETGAKRISLALPGDATIEVPEGSYLEAAVKMLRDETAKTAQTFEADGLAFDQNSKLTPDSAHSAEHLATIAKAYPKAKLKIEARESPGGADDQKERLATAQKQADAVRDALIGAGVPGERVVAEVRAADSLDAPIQTKKTAVYVVIIPQ
ncbi:MAG: DUF937 domain-containing protein [Paludisphaera borealis]|uniref:DUF937 domain-containing protein n=1 Tax=Paludisphaera borealis TaxID=1387353 RepID=UPI0028474275|nr:DUF937 domain-containing protein [Paludisphaera borealis]MDR3620956.1 DUF937 domain-containing protein [Paludisphaera borealis]